MNDLSAADLSALAEKPEPTDVELASVAALAARQRREESDVVAATRALQEVLDRWRHTSMVELPEAMRAIGMSEFKLLDGTRVRIDDKLVGGKLVDPEGLALVERLGGSSAIRTVITVEMDRGDVGSARDLVRELRGHRFANRFKTLALEEYVHQSTVPSLARDWEDGGVLPIDGLDKLKVHRVTRTIVGERAPKTVELKGLTDGRPRAAG